jgi:periplasmic divalent cation tolerance protein
LKLLAVSTTVATLESARQIARALVERRLAACAEIAPIESLYRWKGALANDSEFRIVCKTTEARYPAVAAAIGELHAYELPAIEAVALERVHEPYARWVEESCR